jgi:hypothetical protein
MNGVVGLAVAAVLAAVPLGCDRLWTGSDSRAIEITGAWLRDVSTASSDRGWRWLHPVTQETLGTPTGTVRRPQRRTGRLMGVEPGVDDVGLEPYVRVEIDELNGREGILYLP